MSVDTSYLSSIFYKARFAKTFSEAVEALVKFDAKRPFQTIVFRGQSGAALGYPLGLALDKNITCIRKPSDQSHSDDNIEGYVGNDNYIIVDDFVSSGETMITILNEMKERTMAKCVGIYLYSNSDVPDYVMKKLNVKIRVINKKKVVDAWGCGD